MPIVPVDEPPNLRLTEDGPWPSMPREVLSWLATETTGERFIDNIFVEMCTRLSAAGVPVTRATMFFDTNNPQWLGSRILWQPGMVEAEISRFDYDVEEDADYLDSPMFEVSNGAVEVRQRLSGNGPLPAYPLYAELKDGGFTDYVAWPLKHTFGKRHAVTFATDRPGGFEDRHMAYLRDMLPVLAMVSEIRLKNRMARTLLETYVGPHASAEILAGATRRGTGFTVRAAIMICDLRDFTALSDRLPRDDVIGLLNSYFDAVADPIARHGGEILKFMGDGLLAIFKLDEPMAATKLLRAIGDALTALAMLNGTRERSGQAELRCGMGLHVGDVMYGNVGTSSRLDFTAIGPAVNVASRLESLTKRLGKPVLLSRAFADMAGAEPILEPLGLHTIRGLSEPIEVLAFSSTWHPSGGSPL